MKILLVLLLIWCSFTILLGLDNVHLQEAAEDNLQRRAFIVYYHTFAGCLFGSTDWVANYPKCSEFAYEQKKAYLK